MERTKLKLIIEAALLAAGKPLTADNLLDLFQEEEKPERSEVREAIGSLQEEYAERSIEILEVGGGIRINVRADYAPWISRLWEERPARYSRALLETLAIIAYRQPVTRGEIEEIRGVSVSSSITKTLMERNWIRVVGHRDVPGKPALLATTKEFMNYFGLKGLDQLPTLAEIKDLDSINCELDLGIPGMETGDVEEGTELSEPKHTANNAVTQESEEPESPKTLEDTPSQETTAHE